MEKTFGGQQNATITLNMHDSAFDKNHYSDSIMVLTILALWRTTVQLYISEVLPMNVAGLNFASARRYTMGNHI